MTKCVFCGKEDAPFKGVHLLGNDGSTKFYCSSKCRRNALILGRDKRRQKWTAFYVKGAATTESVANREGRKLEEARTEAKANAAKKEERKAAAKKK